MLISPYSRVAVSLTVVSGCILSAVQLSSLHPYLRRCRGLILIETFTAKTGDQLELPDFLDIDKEVTDDSAYSMHQLALKDATDGANGGLDNGVQLDNGGDEVRVIELASCLRM